MNYNIFLAPEGKLIPSFLITLFDGTNSMEKEYEAYVQIYQELCEKAQLNWKLDYQFTNNFYPLLPFMKSKIGNLTHSLINLLAYLESLGENLPKHITILLISDGREPFQENDYNLQEKIANLKQNHYFQIIILQIGREFPEKTILGLEKIFNNIPVQKTSFIIDRQRKQSLQSMKTLFRSAFKSILYKITVGEQELQFFNSSNQIVQTLPLIVKPKTPFICQEQEIMYENQQLQQINSQDQQFQNHLVKLIEQGLALIEDYRRFYFSQLYILVAGNNQIQEQGKLLDFFQKEAEGSIITPPQTIENLNQFLVEQLKNQINQIQVEQEQHIEQNQIQIEQEQFGQIINFEQSIYEVKQQDQNVNQNQIQVENEQLDLDQKINKILGNYQKDESRYFENVLETTILCLKATLDWFKVNPSNEDNEINLLQKTKNLLFDFVNNQLEQDVPLVKSQDDYATIRALNQVFQDANFTIENKDFEFFNGELEKLQGELSVKIMVSSIQLKNEDKFPHLQYFEKRRNNSFKYKKILIAIFHIDENVRDIMKQLQIDFKKNLQIPQEELLEINFEEYEFVKDQKKYLSLVDLMIENKVITSSKENLKVFMVIFTESENFLLHINRHKKILEINQIQVKQCIYSIGVSFYSQLNQSFQKKQQNNLNKGGPDLKYIPNTVKIRGIWNTQTQAFVKNYSKEIEDIYLNYKKFDND